MGLERVEILPMIASGGIDERQDEKANNLSSVNAIDQGKTGFSGCFETGYWRSSMKMAKGCALCLSLKEPIDENTRYCCVCC